MGACDGVWRSLRPGGAGIRRVAPLLEKSPAACRARPSATERNEFDEKEDLHVGKGQEG